MTGSGSAYFGICRHARHARRLAAALRSRGFAQVFAVAGPALTKEEVKENRRGNH